jgi:hypothetical protein
MLDSLYPKVIFYVELVTIPSQLDFIPIWPWKMLNRENLMANIRVDSSVSSPLSAGSGTMADTVEMKYKLEQSKELLNQGFQILGIAKIRDV